MALPKKTPGVYVEEISKFPRSVVQVGTAIPAFIGYTEKAWLTADNDLVLVPKCITSLLEYEKYFGLAEKETGITVTITEDFDGDRKLLSESFIAALSKGRSSHNMHYAIQLFYANGGGACYIISVGKYTAVFGAAYDTTELKKGLDKLATVEEPTLIVFPEGKFVDSAASYYKLQNDALKQCAELKNRFALIDVYEQSPDSTGNIDAFRGKGTEAAPGIGNVNLKHGAAYYPSLVSTLNYRYEKSDVTIIHTILLNGNLQKVVVPQKTKELRLPAAIGKFDNKKMDDPSFAGTAYYTKSLAAIAGVYTAVDASRGVWKAPANISLNCVKELTVTITEQDSAELNIDIKGGKSVNAIRFFTGKGFIVWGARTLAGNDNEWRYIPVRRFFNMVEESVTKATEAFVFEPNDATTWVKVRAMIENFLFLLWQQGALAGAKPEHAFYVRCGNGETMSPIDILEGRLIIEIGMAAIRPAEFIILRFSHKMQVA